MDERIQLMTNTFDNQILDSNGEFDVDQLIEYMADQMSRISTVLPKYDFFKLFIEECLESSVEEVESGDYLFKINNEFESNYYNFIKEFNDLFLRFYGLNTNSMDLADLYKLYKVLVLNFNSTVAHYIKGMGSVYNEFDNPDAYKLTNNITHMAIDSQSGESLDIMKSMENIQIIDKIESIDNSFSNLLTRCCNVISSDNFFYLASCIDIGNNDLVFIADKSAEGTIYSENREFFSNRIQLEATSQNNLEIIKKIYMSIS